MDGLFPFRHPWVLLGLVLPVVLLFWTWRVRSAALVLPFDHGTGPDGSPRRGLGIGGLVNLAESLPALILAVAVLILAGPQRWDEPRSQRSLTNIEFCVDVSGSMTASFGPSGNRYDGSMQAINEFLDFREGDAFGLTFFGNQVLHWVPLTTDVSAFRCAPPFMRPGRLPRWFGGTEIGKALLACRRKLLEREEGDRMIILVSDGYSADLGGDRGDEIARTLARDGITVYGVHVADSQVPDPIVLITSKTGGEVFNPGDPDALSRVFQAIDAMQETRLEKVRAEAIDDYAPWSQAGLALIGTMLLALFGLRYTPW